MTLSSALPTVVDLFCGCGGMAWGLKKAGFRILAGVDNNKVALKTFALNFPEAKALDLDLSGSAPEQLQELLKEHPAE
jgi:DNA (cytosine-5)-methyltransferase 1